MQKKRLFSTVQGRFTAIIALTVLACMVMVLGASLSSILSVEKSRGQALLEVANRGLSLTIESEYHSLLQTSEMMLPSGVVGEAFWAYCNAKTPMDRYDSQQAFDSILTGITFSVGNEFATYFDGETGANSLGGQYLTKQAVYSEADFPLLYASNALNYHGFHISQSKLSGKSVLSVSRACHFSPGGSTVIYVELPTTAPEFLSRYSSQDRTDYWLLQLDGSGTVCYSSKDTLPVGADLSGIVAAGSDFGEWNGYLWCRSELDFGCWNVLLLPKSEVYSAPSILLRPAVISFLASIAIVAVSAFLLSRLILQKNVVLYEQIGRVGEGALEPSAVKTGLYEYDLLLDRFNWMVQRIRQLIDEVREQERQRGELRRELLYYQINPHFLLNSLNSAYWLSRLGGSEETGQYLSRLTELLRYSLGRDNDQPTLRREAQILKSYLELERQRHDFTYTLEVEEGDYLEMPVPRLFIQPAAENAIQHGMDVDGHLDIRIRREGGWALVTVQDDGIGMDEATLRGIISSAEQPAGSRGIGLRYVQVMLQSFFGGRAAFEIRSGVNQGTTILLRLPVPGKETDTEHDARTDR